MSVRRIKAPPTIDHAFAARGHRWRVQSDESGRFDEIVVVVGKDPAPKTTGKNGLVLHAEMMNLRECFVDVAGLCLYVSVGKDGVARITCLEDRRVPANGTLEFVRWRDVAPKTKGKRS